MNIISADEARAMSKEFKTATADFIDSIIEEINHTIEIYARVGNRYIEFAYPLNVFPSSRESAIPYAVHNEIQHQLIDADYLVTDIRDDDGDIVGLEITWDKY